MAAVDQHIDAGEAGAAAQVILDQLRPVVALLLGDGGEAVARHVDEAEAARHVEELSCCVRPGVCEVRASALRPVTALISDDLPTFERPAKAISGTPIGGRPSICRRPR